MAFQAASGFDQTGSYTTITPIPYTPGILYGRIVRTLDAEKYRDAKHTEWRWEFLTPTQKAAIDTALGLSQSTPSAACTIQTLINDYSTYDDFNAIALLPEPDTDYTYEGGMYLNVVYRFAQLEEA